MLESGKIGATLRHSKNAVLFFNKNKEKWTVESKRKN